MFPFFSNLILVVTSKKRKKSGSLKNENAAYTELLKSINGWYDGVDTSAKVI